VPLLPAVIVIQDALFDTDHVQPAWVATLTVPVPPDALKNGLVGEIE
jgi:hypothetical protein